MQLTQRQEQEIVRYMRDVARHLASLPDRKRMQALAALHGQIESDVAAAAAGRNPVEVDVAQVLRRYGSPEVRAAAIRQIREEESKRLALAALDRRWLGVCGGIARRLGVSSLWFRLAALLLGLVTGPIAIALYLVVYFVMYALSDKQNVPHIAPGKLAGMILGTLAGAAALYAGGYGALRGLTWLYAEFMERDPATLGAWNWLAAWNLPLLKWTFVFAVPLAILAGLPLASQWDKTLKTCVQAIVAVYAFVICCGLGSVLAGIVLAIVQNLIT